MDLDLVELLGWSQQTFVSIDLAQRTILHISPDLAARFGMTREALEGLALTEEILARTDTWLEPAARDRLVALFDAPGGYVSELRIPVGEGGGTRWRLVRIRVVETSAGRRLDAIGQDATELIAAEKARAAAVLFFELGESVLRATELSAAIAAAAELVRRHYDAEVAQLTVFGNESTLISVRTTGSSGPTTWDRAAISTLVARHGRSGTFDASVIADDPQLSSLGGPGGTSYAVLGGGNDVLGILSVGANTSPRRFTHEEMAMLRELANVLTGPLAQKALEQERREAAQVLAKTEERLRTALIAGGIGIWEVDFASGETHIDQRCYQLWEIDPKDGMQLELVRSRVNPDDLVALDSARERAADPRGKGILRSEYRYDAPSGLRYIDVRGHYHFDAMGAPTRFIGTLQDVTETRQLEAKLVAAQKLESLGVLAGGIAHDFNNLLVGVLGNAGLAKLELAPSSPVLDSINGIETAALRASELTRQLLAYAGKGRFVITTFSLQNLVEEMAHLLNAVIGKGVVLRYKFEADVPPVRGDATQLRQVVMNLITNASDAIGDKSGIITISTSLVDVDRTYLEEVLFDENLAPGYYVCLQISDTGAGMDAETQARIFEPFFTTKFTGRGLGLAAVLGILRAHRGLLKVYTELGSGTTFKMLLPATDQGVESERVPPGPLTGEASGMVLVVDDEETVRAITRRILTRSGYEVVVASDGAEGVERYRSHHRSLSAVILDITMPRMGGEEAFRLMRQIDSTVPVILTSGYSEQEATSQFAGKGAAGFIEKPFRPTALLDKIREVTAQRG